MNRPLSKTRRSVSLAQLRPATPADLPAIRRIEQATAETAHWPDIDYFAYDCLIAEVDLSVAGYLLSRPVAEAESEVLNIAVAPGFRRRGIASALIRSRAAASAGDWFLEVRESNTAARNLYKNIGFEEIGRRPSYYDNPPETAIVMRFRS